MELSAEQWRDRLDKQLEARRPKIERFERYYLGRHQLNFATNKYRDAFGKLFSAFADNWIPLVVDAPVGRLEVNGFRFGDEGETADKDAWAIWQANGLDAQSVIAHTEAVKNGESYILVAPPVEDGGQPIITVEHPSQMIVAYAAGNRRVRLAAWKKWLDDSGYIFGNLYLADAVVKWRSKSTVAATNAAGTFQWVFRDEQNPADQNPLGVVPVVALCNNPTMLHGGRSDLESIIPLQDALNKLATDMIIASEFAAYRQRYATGVEIPTDPTTGKPMTEQFLSEVSRMWVVGDPDVKFGEFNVTDLSNYTNAIEMIVQHIAAQSQTPPHYLLGQVVNLSADALKAAETGLVMKVRREQLDFGESWEEAMRIAFRASGDTAKAQVLDAETLWRDPESRTEAQKADAAVKMQTLGVPWEFIMEYLGYSPQQIERMRAARSAEQMTNALNQMLAQPAAPDPQQPGQMPQPMPMQAQPQPPMR